MPRHFPALDSTATILPAMRARLQVIHLLAFPNFGLPPGRFTFRIARAPSELGQRGCYARWAAIMDGKLSLGRW